MTSALREERSLNALFSGLSGIICYSIFIRLIARAHADDNFCSLNFEPNGACRLLPTTAECAVCYTHKRTRCNVMSAQKQTSAHIRVMSASPSKADIVERDHHVR